MRFGWVIFWLMMLALILCGGYVVKAKACDIVTYVWVALTILYLAAQIVRAL